MGNNNLHPFAIAIIMKMGEELRLFCMIIELREDVRFFSLGIRVGDLPPKQPSGLRHGDNWGLL